MITRAVSSGQEWDEATGIKSRHADLFMHCNTIVWFQRLKVSRVLVSCSNARDYCAGFCMSHFGSSVWPGSHSLVWPQDKTGCPLSIVVVVVSGMGKGRCTAGVAK